MSSDRSDHLTDHALHEYLDGELEAKQRAAAQHHLQGCKQCGARLKTWGSLFTEIEQLPELDPALDFAPAILARLPDPTLRRSRPFWLMVGQALLSLAMLAYGWLQIAAWVPAERIGSWLSLPLRSMNAMIDTLIFAITKAFNQFLAWSPSSSDIITHLPQLPDGGPLLIYLVILVIALWIVSNHYLLKGYPHPGDTRS
ncbi:MAG: hypothetical protein E4G99_00090 [Anaerolineales bacterium]|nr:MAG: hypothetical protein E4G99_00090 [Anaerolineales bacterium]